MKRWMILSLVGAIALSLSFDADAQRRLGGGRNLGKQSPQVQQRQATPPAAPAAATTPAAAAAAPAAGATIAAARPASPLRNILIGAAAGLGLMALASYLGFGEAFANMLLIGLVVMLVFGTIAWFMRRRTAAPAYQGAAGTVGGYGVGGPSYAPPPSVDQTANRSSTTGSSTTGSSTTGSSTTGSSTTGSSTTGLSTAIAATARPGSAMDELLGGGAAPSQPFGIPADFDTAGFLAQAKQQFAKLQAAWDRANLDELSEFTTQEMFTALTHELNTRGGKTSTEVVTLDATLLGIDSSATEHLASVRFKGSLRVDDAIEPVDEVWNLAKPVDGKTGWLLAGIQQLS